MESYRQYKNTTKEKSLVVFVFSPLKMHSRIPVLLIFIDITFSLFKKLQKPNIILPILAALIVQTVAEMVADVAIVEALAHLG